jgi:hypothetical protein
MLFQPAGEVTGHSEFIGNSNQESAHLKHLAFFQLAKDKAVHLALCPEYSCPWQTITALIRDSVLPPDDALWVIGCEAITPADLVTFKAANPTVTWINETLVARGDRKFCDPILYCFKTRDAAGTTKLVVVVQFKTQEMAERDEFLERNHLIKGEAVYILRNDPSSIYLLTLICSDALSFTPANLLNQAHPHLILHLQLNPNPRHHAISSYRGGLFHNVLDNREIISLNWAARVGIRGKDQPLNDIAGSAFYTKAASNQLDLHDAAVLQNHNHGLYLTTWKSARSHAFFLNHKESIFYFSTTRPSQHGSPPETAKRTGPTMISTFSWQEASSTWAVAAACDSGIDALCAQFQLSDLKRTAAADHPLDFERLLTLSCGLIHGDKWDNSLDGMALFQIQDTEIILRISLLWKIEKRNLWLST